MCAFTSLWNKNIAVAVAAKARLCAAAFEALYAGVRLYFSLEQGPGSNRVLNCQHCGPL